MKTFALSLALLPLAAFAADPALTIFYNQDFAVVRETVPLDLKEGVNSVAFSGISALLEPDSVILRDPSGKTQLQILEQNFRNDTVSRAMMLSLYEGKEIDFLVHESHKADRVVKGKIIRSGYMPHQSRGADLDPLIEVEGKLQFQLPGLPVFPALDDQSILKPQLGWELNASAAGKLDAELCYVSGGMSWSADYNLVASEKGDLVDLVGWVTMNNRTGKTFDNAKVKLMAGDVNKIQDNAPRSRMELSKFAMQVDAAQPPVTEKSFDEYHLYTLQRPVTLHDKETKQVEFVRASGSRHSGSMSTTARISSDSAVWTRFPSGTIRNTARSQTQRCGSCASSRIRRKTTSACLCQKAASGSISATMTASSNSSAKTRSTTRRRTRKSASTVGNAFDITGERKRVDFRVNNDEHWADEAFEIKLRNHKTEPVTVNVVEHLYRWVNWEIRDPSTPFTKKDSQLIEFPVELKPDEEKQSPISCTTSGSARLALADRMCGRESRRGCFPHRRAS